ncbi:hypothetical protein TNCV_4614731 [Trichonephila clavipes]|nr:hypothetical protein TNCV_4614731 [Trichonephila clavipes]
MATTEWLLGNFNFCFLLEGPYFSEILFLRLSSLNVNIIQRFSLLTPHFMVIDDLEWFYQLPNSPQQ